MGDGPCPMEHMNDQGLSLSILKLVPPLGNKAKFRLPVVSCLQFLTRQGT